MRDLEADLKICEAATPGPYRIRRDDVGDEHTCIVPIEIIAADGSKIVAYEGGLAPDENWTARQLEANAAFIAAARTGWPEAIERAIKAEAHIEMLSNECDMCKNDKETLALETIAELREENDIQRASIQQLSAQVAGLREGLEEIKARCELRTMDDDAHYENHYEAKRLLAQPDPGAEIMERMKKQEAAGS